MTWHDLREWYKRWKFERWVRRMRGRQITVADVLEARKGWAK